MIRGWEDSVNTELTNRRLLNPIVYSSFFAHHRLLFVRVSEHGTISGLGRILQAQTS